jgi:hypothetical protein
MIFDTGSDRLIVPSVDCVSDACQKHTLYDSSKSTTAANLSDPEACEATFGTGHVEGYEAEDRVCLGEACAEASFVQALEESDQPFLDAGFDGVAGLSLQLRGDAARKTSLVSALVDGGAIPRAQFSVYMARDMRSDNSEITFGEPDPSRADGPTFWTQISEPGYWQFSLADLAIGGQHLDLCGRGHGANSSMAALTPGANVSSFYGKMCCRSLDEFDHEERCQYTSSFAGWRSRYTDSAVVLAEYPDGRAAVRLHDGCVQKVPHKWISFSNGCRGDGTIQAVLDTGSSLMMGPKELVDKVLAAIGVKENCTLQDRQRLPPVLLTLPEGNNTLTLEPEEYMDIVALADGVYCWPHFLSTPAETAKGSALILGMPFLRAYYATFDATGQRIGFARAARGQLQRAPLDAGAPSPNRSSLRAVALHGRRPEVFDSNLVAALRSGEHWG